MVKISRLKKLRKKSKLYINGIKSRLSRNVLAEWTQVNPQDEDAIQLLTESMNFGYPVQIDYEGSGWRTIQPYGWNTSKEGNILLMCYKDNGEVRSYRMDRINDLFIDKDSSGSIVTVNNPSMSDDNDLDSFMKNVYDSNETVDINTYEDDYPYDMPTLPGEDQGDKIDMSPGIYDEELNILENDNYIDEQTMNPMLEEQPIDNIQDNIIEPEVDNINQNEENTITEDEINTEENNNEEGEQENG